ncbi:MAG: hypothetical protein J6S73_06015 [Lentisphaeria bacterium]|nr:hypothetical protein [Lentisphaeria bacterium]
MFKSICLSFMCLALVSVSAAENLIRQEGGWQGADVDAELSKTEGTRVLRISKPKAWIFLGEKMAVDPAKTYTVSMELRSADAAALSRVNYIGLVQQDSRSRSLVRDFVYAVPGAAVAKVAADAAKGAKEIILEGTVDLSRQGGKGICLAFNAKEDFSDLPNRDLSGKVLRTAVVNGNTVFTLAQPLRHDVKAGTAARCHYHSAGFTYGVLMGGLTADWKKFTCRITGVADKGTADYNKFWPGVKTFQLLFVVNNVAGVASEVLVKNISVTAE